MFSRLRPGSSSSTCKYYLLSKVVLFFVVLSFSSSFAAASHTAHPQVPRSWVGLEDASLRLDDGITPATQVADVVVGECRSEWGGFLVLTAGGTLPRWAQAMSEYPTPKTLEMSTKAVLLARRPKLNPVPHVDWVG